MVQVSLDGLDSPLFGLQIQQCDFNMVMQLQQSDRNAGGPVQPIQFAFASQARRLLRGQAANSADLCVPDCATLSNSTKSQAIPMKIKLALTEIPPATPTPRASPTYDPWLNTAAAPYSVRFPETRPTNLRAAAHRFVLAQLVRELQQAGLSVAGKIGYLYDTNNTVTMTVDIAALAVLIKSEWVVSIEQVQ